MAVRAANIMAARGTNRFNRPDDTHLLTLL